MLDRTVIRAGFVVAILALTSVVEARATAIFAVGNTTRSTFYYVQGQSFTPSTLGNDGIGVPEASSNNTVFLSVLSFDFLPSEMPPSELYLYNFVPTIEQVHSQGNGRKGVGKHVGAGAYRFDSLEIPFDAKSYAILPESRSIYDAQGNQYTGGVDIFPREQLVQEGYGDFDTSFNAIFSTKPLPSPIPEPSTFTFFALGLVGLGSRFLRKR